MRPVGSLPIDDPRAYIAGDRRRALNAHGSLAEDVSGAALFADVSGFTALTEALAIDYGERRGGEELVAHLNEVLSAIIEDLHGFGGEVIYFSGDAITCWLDEDDGIRATACGLAMQATMAGIGDVETSAGPVSLTLKVGIAVGSARRFVVGDPQLQLIDVLAGLIIDELADADEVAEPGEIVLSPSGVTALAGEVLLRETRDGCGIVDSLRSQVAPEDAPTNLEDLPEETVREWLLPAVYDRLSAGAGALVAELRSVHPMFIRFSGIDFDADADAPAKLDEFVRRAQRILDTYGGNLLQLTLGDKGAYLYAVFGSLQAHEDEAIRSVGAARELVELPGVTAAADIEIGITMGRVLSGTCGHPLRRTFACLGDPVNLAARLMSRAAAGEILATEEVAVASATKYRWRQRDQIALKGKAHPVTPFSLEGECEPAPHRHDRYPLPMVGREREMAFIRNRLESASAGRRRVVGIVADPGMGKSRLVAAVLEELGDSGIRVVYGEAEAIGRTTSYLSWRDPWRELLGIGHTEGFDAFTLVERRLAEFGHGAARRAPLLDVVLGLDFPDNALTASFDPKLRKTSLESLLGDLLNFELDAQPLSIVLDDLHWADESSLDLLDALVRVTADKPLLLIVAYRSEIDQTMRQRLMDLPGYEELVLAELSDDDVRRVIEAKAAQQFGRAGNIAPEIVDRIANQGRGNPFYIEELINFLYRNEIDVSDGASLGQLEIPESLQSLVLRRIDSLDPHSRQTLKVASVAGREFDVRLLDGISPGLGDDRTVARHLEILGGADLIAQERGSSTTWQFRHPVTREVTYESIPFRVRADLHEAAGTHLEAASPDGEPDLDLLAHHFWNSDNTPKKIDYQRRAGQAARHSYANGTALEYLGRLKGLVESSERAGVLLELGEVYELVGDWDAARSSAAEAFDLATSTGDHASMAWAEVALAEIDRRQGKYAEASQLLDSAATRFVAASDRTGRGRVLHLAGTLAAQQGELDRARTLYEESLEIRRALGDRAGMASLLSNLGVVAEYSDNLDLAESSHEEALRIRTELDDIWAIAVSNTNLGMIAILSEDFDRARDLFEDAMRLNQEVGDSWMVAVSHNNLGNAYRGLNELDRARSHYGASADAYRSYGDRWATAFLLEDVAVLAAKDGAASTAVPFIGAADRLRDEIDTPRAESQAEDLAERVLGLVSDADRASLLELGHSWGLSEALEQIAAYCVTQ